MTNDLREKIEDIIVKYKWENATTRFEVIDYLLSLFKKEWLSLIGKNERETGWGIEFIVRNQLRKELREKVKKI